MSEAVRVGVVAEGTTDHILIEQIIAAKLHPKEVLYTALQPEISAAFSPIESSAGFGWGGVYKWAKQVCSEGGGSLSGSLLAEFFDILVVHVDCDVASASYGDIGCAGERNDLPCMMPCPPAASTIERLENVLFGWLGGGDLPKLLVPCVPAQSTEGWVLAALYPTDPDVVACRTDCLIDPHIRLSTKPSSGRMVSSGKKRVAAYRARAQEIAGQWPELVLNVHSAARFDSALSRALLAVG